MMEFIQSINNDELKFISRLDYGAGIKKHYAALKALIFEQGGIVNEDQYWYPYEVIELGSNSLQAGHEREFTICTLIVIHNVISGSDKTTDLEYKFETHAGEYDMLPETCKSLVMAAYERASL